MNSCTPNFVTQNCVVEHLLPWHMEDESFSDCRQNRIFLPEDMVMQRDGTHSGSNLIDRRIKYLMNLDENGSPFTLHQERIFYTSELAEKNSYRFLRTTYCVLGTAAVVNVISACIPASPGMLASVAAINGCAGCTSFISTGTSTYNAGNEGMKRHEMLAEARKIYTEIAIVILLKKSPKKKMAKINVKNIIKKMNLCVSLEETKDITESLVAVKKYLKYKTKEELPIEIRLAVENFELKNRVEKLEKLMMGSQEERTFVEEEEESS